MINRFLRIYAIIKKEFRQIFRDKKLLYVIFIFPILLLVLFGYAVNFDVKHIKMTIYDQDKSELSRTFINSLTSNEYFILVKYLNSDKEVKRSLDTKEAQVVMVIPKDLSKNFYSNKKVKIQYLIDGVDGNAATIIMNYVNYATTNYSNKITNEVISRYGKKSFVPIDLQPRFWFNPDLSSSRFLVPGLIAMILIITAVVSVALSIVREKEKTTIEQINVSPINSFEFILGKTVPYALISLFVSILILFCGYILFDVQMKGSFILFILTTLLFIFASVNFGIFISAISENQQVAFQLASISSLLPSVLLSGFVFPIESMPVFIQILTNITPSKFYLSILRSIVLKGVGIETFYDQIIYLLIFSTIFGVLAIIKTKKSRII